MTPLIDGRPGPERALVREGQDILRSYDIDPLHGIENLVRAPNKGHTMDATQRLVDELRFERDAGSDRSIIVDILRKHGQKASER